MPSQEVDGVKVSPVGPVLRVELGRKILDPEAGFDPVDQTERKASQLIFCFIEGGVKNGYKCWQFQL